MIISMHGINIAADIKKLRGNHFIIKTTLKLLEPFSSA